MVIYLIYSRLFLLLIIGFLLLLTQESLLKVILIILKKNLKKEEILNLAFFIRINFHYPVSKNWQHPNMFF